MIEPTQGHLRAPSVVHTQEEHCGNARQRPVLGVGQGFETLQGELLCRDGQPLGDRRLLRHLVVALEDERLDGLQTEGAVELGVQVFDHVVELNPLLRCHRFVLTHVPPLPLGRPL